MDTLITVVLVGFDSKGQLKESKKTTFCKHTDFTLFNVRKDLTSLFVGDITQVQIVVNPQASILSQKDSIESNIAELKALIR